MSYRTALNRLGNNNMNGAIKRGRIERIQAVEPIKQSKALFS